MGRAYTLGANVEQVVLTGTGNINVTGGPQTTYLLGNDGANVIDGQAGLDKQKISSGKGNDTLIGGITGDWLDGPALR